MTLKEAGEAIGFALVISGVFVLILVGVGSCVKSQMTDQCENRWAEAYEWKYVHTCKIKIDGKWVPEDVLIDRKGAK